MDEALQARLRMRHQQILETLIKAQEMIDGAEIQLADLTHMRIHLKLSIGALERETYKFIESCGNTDNLSSQCMEEQMKAEDILSRLECLNESISTNGTNNKETNQQVARLPKLDLLKYNGDILKFTEFWDQFEANVDSRNLKDVDKLSYLLGSLQGAALETVEGLCITNANYKVALDTLKERFGSKEKVIDAHYNELLNINKCSGDANSCRQTINTIEKHLRVLQNLGENTNSSHLRVLLSNKFPENVMYQVHLLSPSGQSIEKLRQSLDQVITAMERSGPESVAAVRTTDNPIPSTASLYVGMSRQRGAKRNLNCSNKPNKEVAPFQKSRKQCIFCTEAHFSNQCLKVSSLKERKEKLHGRCFICFKKGHNAKDCKTKKTCFFCKGAHNSALCPKQNKKEQEPKAIETDCSGENSEQN